MIVSCISSIVKYTMIMISKFQKRPLKQHNSSSLKKDTKQSNRANDLTQIKHEFHIMSITF